MSILPPVVHHNRRIFMTRNDFFNTQSHKTVFVGCVLGCFVSLGSVLGMILAHFTDFSFTSVMRMALQEHVSIVSISVSLLLPFLLCIFAALLSASWLLYLICFARSVSFSFVSTCLFMTFGSGGWLLRGLVMFGHIVSFPLMIWICLRYAKGNRPNSFSAVRICLPVLALITAADYSISIFLRQLRL